MTHKPHLNKFITIILCIGLFGIFTTGLVIAINSVLINQSQSHSLLSIGRRSQTATTISNNPQLNSKLNLELSVDVQKANSNELFPVTLMLKNRFLKPIPLVYVTIFKIPDGHPAYDYSILRTNQLGETNFFLAKGEYDLYISTNDRSLSQANSDFFFIHYKLNINTPVFLAENLILYPLKMSINKAPSLPTMKVEASYLNPYYTHNEMVAQKFEFQSSVNFYLSPGSYNLNFDTINFYKKDTVTYNLAAKNVNIPTDNYVEFDYPQLTTFPIEIADIDYGWFKTISSNTGDYQSMYFGEPVSDRTNLNDLQVKMIYTPLTSCVNYFLDIYKSHQASTFEPPEQAINACADTDLRFDFVGYNIKNNQKISIKPPSKLTLISNKLSLNQGDILIIDSLITNSDKQQIRNISIHQLWDTQILPKITFMNMQTHKQYEFDAFNDQYLPYTTIIFNDKVCISPGKYKVSAKLPIRLWASNDLSDSFILEVKPGQMCDLEKTHNLPFNFSSWQELYALRIQLFRSSSGYLMDFPSLHHSNYQPAIDQSYKIISSCDDLESLEKAPAKNIIVNLTTDLVFDLEYEKKFTQCLLNYGAHHPNSYYLIKNSFYDKQQPFPSINIYVIYYYYLVLNQTKPKAVGIIGEKFFDLFFAFPDVVVLDSKYFLNVWGRVNILDKKTILNWIDNYRDLINSPIYFTDKLPLIN
jgi:hypothetical protein